MVLQWDLSPGELSLNGEIWIRFLQPLFNIYQKPAECWVHAATKTFGKTTRSDLKGRD